jgi:hypothetical protein
MSQISRSFGRMVTWSVLGLGVSTAAAFAAQTSMQLTGPGPNGVLASVYVGPYQAVIGGSGVPVPVICDDFADETWVNESWTANVFNSADLNNPAILSQTKWANLGLYQ